MLNKPQFATWVKNVDELSATRPDTKISTISTLKAYYGDEALSQMIIAAQKNPKTQQLADELQTRQLQYWLDNKKTPADVFKLLELSKAGDNLLDNPQVSTWLSYVADFKKKTPRKSQESIPILTTHYGDEALSKILLEAKQTPSDKLLDNPQFATWLSYVDDFNWKDPRISRISVMARYYGDETLTKMLFEAMKTPSTANIAAKFHEEQIQLWLNTQKSPGDVFKFLSLNKADEKLFDNPQFMTWVKYVDDLSKGYSDKKTTVMSVLATHYNNDGLVKLLESARNAPRSSKLVKRLEAEQKWLTKETPDDLFKRLKLDKMENDVLISPQLKTWINYMKEYNAANPKYQTTLIGTMAANYGNVKLVKVRDEAMKVKGTASTAKKLQSELFQRWVQKGWAPNYIFQSVLHLDEAGDKIFTNPLVVTWGKYLSAFNRDNLGKETTVWTKLAATDYDPDDVIRIPGEAFSKMGLTNAGDDLLANPQFVNWIQYLDDF
ncbi:hypothetical protein PC114_g26434 [Phytophthora cactorum]|nr:hypothetical protein PC114_g26434 [Phytophthora cactorum]